MGRPPPTATLPWRIGNKFDQVSFDIDNLSLWHSTNPRSAPSLEWG
jgi:hypothetical protein